MQRQRHNGIRLENSAPYKEPIAAEETETKRAEYSQRFSTRSTYLWLTGAREDQLGLGYV